MNAYSTKMYLPSKKEDLEYYFKQPKFNTNICQIEFQVLKDQQKQAMGDPIFCEKCNASLSSFSKLEKKVENNNNSYQWKCEFCENISLLENLEPEEIPQHDDLCYILETNNQQINKNANQDDISIVFCIDFSGSMNATHETNSQQILNLDNQALKELENLKQFMEPFEYQQYKQMVISQQNKFISRKDCVLAAIKDQIANISKEFPTRKIGLVTFNDDVIIIGDGKGEEKVITGDKLYKYEQVLEESQQYAQTHMKQPIIETGKELTDKFSQLEPYGKTALGPALLSSIGLLNNAKAGSQIIICTDGLSNIGFGALDTDEATVTSQPIYDQITNLALEKGIQISVITVKGEQCKIITLGNIADKTQGKITKVNPQNIQNDFASILKEEILGTKVNLKVQLHHGLKFINYEVDEITKLVENKLVKNIGNATARTHISFEYDFKSPEELKKENKSIDDLKKIGKLPIQAKIEYYSPEGHKMLRIITKFLEISDKEKEVHVYSNLQVLQRHQNQLNCRNALRGDLGSVQSQQMVYENFMRESEQRSLFSNEQMNQIHKNRQQEYKMNEIINKKAQFKAKKQSNNFSANINNYYGGDSYNNNNQLFSLQQQQQGGIGGGLFGQQQQSLSNNQANIQPQFQQQYIQQQQYSPFSQYQQQQQQNQFYLPPPGMMNINNHQQQQQQSENVFSFNSYQQPQQPQQQQGQEKNYQQNQQQIKIPQNQSIQEEAADNEDEEDLDCALFNEDL